VFRVDQQCSGLSGGLEENVFRAATVNGNES